MIAVTASSGRRSVDLHVDAWPPSRAYALHAAGLLTRTSVSNLRGSSVWLEAAGRAVVAHVHVRRTNRRLAVAFARRDP